MRQQSHGKMWLYVVLVAVAALALWAISNDIPFTPETVEQPIENTFAN